MKPRSQSQQPILSYQPQLPIAIAIPSYFEILCTWIAGAVIGCVAIDLTTMVMLGEHAGPRDFKIRACIFPIAWLVSKLVNVRLTRKRLLWLAIGGPFSLSVIFTGAMFAKFGGPTRIQ